MSLLCRRLTLVRLILAWESIPLLYQMKKVTVISDEETLSKVDRVIAILPTSERITGNYSSSVPLQAVDKMEMSYQASLCHLTQL